MLVFLTLPAAIRGGQRHDKQTPDQLTVLPIPFVVNEGQLDQRVSYSAHTFAGTIFVTRDGMIVYSLLANEEIGEEVETRWTLTESLVGGTARPSGEDRAETKVSYLLGNDRRRWRSCATTYHSIALGEVWPGITVSLRARGGNVEKFFTLAPGASAEAIRVHVGGARSLRIDTNGALIAGTGLGEIVLTSPNAYQEKGGRRFPVTAAYRVKGHSYGVLLGPHDPAAPVVIDPILQSTYLGGSLFESALALTVHPKSGDVLVAGRTASSDFPGTGGGAQPVLKGGVLDAFVARFNSTLTSLLQATYLGGADQDEAYALTVHPTSGEVLVAGFTRSTDFPATAGGAQAFTNFGGDAFVARLDPTLTSLRQATYLGGSEQDSAYAIAVHPTTGEIILTGSTASFNFPGTDGGAQPISGHGAFDAFVARFNSALTALVQTTYLGGSNGDNAYSLAIDPKNGEILVAGKTDSANFPGTTGGAQPLPGGAFNNFVARFNPTLTSLLQATYLGGDGLYYLTNSVTVYPATGEVFLAGTTDSTSFPGTAGGAQPLPGGPINAFVARFNPVLTSLLQATYLGGSGNNAAFALTVHPTSGDILVAGATSSTDFPGTAGGAQAISGGQGDGFIARLSPTLKSLFQATYIGSRGNEGVNSLNVHQTSGEILVCGDTDSMDFPGTAGGAQATITNSLYSDTFVARLTADLAGVAATPTPTPTLAPIPTRTLTPPSFPTVPTLSFPLLAVLAFALGFTALFVLRRV